MCFFALFFFFKQKTAYEMRISDWSSDVCSSDLGFTLPSCKMEFHPGGAFQCLMRSPEGSEHRMHGVYREIVEPEKISFSWTWIDEAGNAGHETLVTVTLEEASQDGDQTRLTMPHAVFAPSTARDAHNGRRPHSSPRP